MNLDPAMQEQAIKFAMLMAEPEFQKLLQAMAQSKVRNALYLSEAGLALALFLFRTWKGRSIETFAGRVVFQLWTLVVYLVLSAYVVPRYWLGPDLDRLLSMLKPVLPSVVSAYWPW